MKLLMNKSKIYMIISIFILVLSISGSLAWYVWKSTNNTYVSLGVCTPQISFIGGTTLNGNDLMPTLSREKGLKKPYIPIKTSKPE